MFKTIPKEEYDLVKSHRMGGDIIKFYNDMYHPDTFYTRPNKLVLCKKFYNYKVTIDIIVDNDEWYYVRSTVETITNKVDNFGLITSLINRYLDKFNYYYKCDQLDELKELLNYLQFMSSIR